MIRWIRSQLLNLFFYLGCLIWAILLVPVMLVPGRAATQRGLEIWLNAVLGAFRLLAGCTVEVRGREHIPKDKAFILCAKHQSDVDPVIAYTLFPNMTALAKKELFRVPFVGQVLHKLEIIRIDRQGGKAHFGMDQVAATVITSKRPLLVYPEGTRAKIGETKKLKSGAYYLQRGGDLPVLTVATNSGLYWPKGHPFRYSGRLIFEIHPPLESGLSKRDFMAALEARVIRRSDELMAEADVSPRNLYQERT